MQRIAIVAAALALVAQAEAAAMTMEVTLPLPRPLGAGESAWVSLEVGAIGRGQEITVVTTSGQQLGTISTYGPQRGQSAGTYTLPVPGDAIRNGQLALQLTITQPGAALRAPIAAEVRSVKLTIGNPAH